jgi:hypothetical protein
MATKVKATVRQKREQAQDRQKAHDSLTPQQKLKKLDGVPGDAKRERTKLLKVIEETTKALKEKKAAK